MVNFREVGKVVIDVVCVVFLIIDDIQKVNLYLMQSRFVLIDIWGYFVFCVVIGLSVQYYFGKVKMDVILVMSVLNFDFLLWLVEIDEDIRVLQYLCY